jgi:hypothetical protein
MYPKIDVMEREYKKLEVGRDLNKALIDYNSAITIRMTDGVMCNILERKDTPS